MKSQCLDLFDDALPWLPVASGEGLLELSARRCALRMDFDFMGGRGFVVARRELRHTMPAEFMLRFRLWGRGPVNHLELKLVDESGKNVWRRVWTDFHLPARGRELRVASHEIEFAWGACGWRRGR